MNLQLTLCGTSYLWGSLLLIPLWLAIYIKQPSTNTRYEMLIIGLVFGAASVIIALLYSLDDYWHPPYIFGKWLPIEDLLYGFIFGGITSEFYEFVFRPKEVKERLVKRRFLGFVFLAVMVIGMFLMVSVLKINSLTAMVIVALFIGIATVIIRKDLFIPALLSGILIVLLQFLWYWIILAICPSIFSDYWKMENLSGIMILKIPLEEVAFAFALGFGAAHVYEMITGKQMKF